jgi:CMP-N-acetylneuraminic acid synthetase
MSSACNSPVIYGLVPARGRSVRLAGKNLRPLCGRPMIDYTFAAATEVRCLERVICSTDDPRIAARARAFGVAVPFLRPARLAADDADVTDVILHALDFLAGHGERPDGLMVLQATSPLRAAEDVRNAAAIFAERDCDGVVSITADPGGPAVLRRMDADGRLAAAVDPGRLAVCNSQQRPPCYRLNGAIFLRRVEVYRRWRQRAAAGEDPEGGCVLGYEMPPERSVDVDDALDFALAELLMRQSAAVDAPR